MENINTEAENYEYNDDDVDTEADIGKMILGIPGAIVGVVIGGAIGCIRSVLDDIF